MRESRPASQYLFNDYSSYIRHTFGERVRKISLNMGFSCPNRDGTKAYHGCSYCNISSIQPSYATRALTVSEQLEKGIGFFQTRGNTRRFLAYFQSYTNTYRDFEIAQKAYEEALAFPGVVGIVIGTRPDCISEEMASYLRRLAKQNYVSLEIGIESTDDNTLKRVNRCHSYAEVVVCLESFRHSNIHLGGHLILGFPWESRETMLEHASRISLLPLHSIKLHHLQILKHTQLAREHRESPFQLMDFDSYFDLVTEFVERTRPNLIFQRFLAEAPLDLLIAPHFNGIRNYEFVHLLHNRLSTQNSHQGKRFDVDEAAR